MKREVKPGQTIAGMMVAVVLCGIVFTLLLPGSPLLPNLLLVVGILLSLRWIVLPIWVVSRQRVNADSPIVEFNPESNETPEHVRENLRAVRPGLEHLGFTPLAHLLRGDPGIRGQQYVRLLANTRTRQTARLITVIVRNSPDPRIETSLLFRTDFTDGTRSITSNNKTATVVPPPPHNRQGSMSFPQVGDVSLLHQIHEAVVTRYASDGVRQLPQMSDPASYLRASVKEEFASWVEQGYYTLDEQERAYRPTWKGAVLMGLRLSAPYKVLRERLRRRRTNRLLNELGFAPVQL